MSSWLCQDSNLPGITTQFLALPRGDCEFFFIASLIYPGGGGGGKEGPCEFLALPRLKFTRGGDWGFPTLGHMPLTLVQTALSSSLPRHAGSSHAQDLTAVIFHIPPPPININTARFWRAYTYLYDIT